MTCHILFKFKVQKKELLNQTTSLAIFLKKETKLANLFRFCVLLGYIVKYLNSLKFYVKFIKLRKIIKF